MPQRFLLVEMGDGGTQHARVIAAGQAAVAGDHHQRRARYVLMGLEQRVVHRAGGARQVGDQLRQLLGVRLGRHGAFERGLKTGRGDELHRPRDLADVAHRLAPFDEDSSVRHRRSPRRLSAS